MHLNGSDRVSHHGKAKISVDCGELVEQSLATLVLGRDLDVRPFRLKKEMRTAHNIFEFHSQRKSKEQTNEV